MIVFQTETKSWVSAIQIVIVVIMIMKEHIFLRPMETRFFIDPSAKCCGKVVCTNGRSK